MRKCGFIVFFIVMLIYIVININAITKTINAGECRNANGNNKSLSKSKNTINYNTKEQSFSLSSKTRTTTRGISKTIANESNETLLSLMTTKLMTAHKIEISTAKPSNFNKNSLRQREGQQEEQKSQKQQKQQHQRLLPQQRHYKHQNTLDNKHPPCDYVEHTSSVVGVVVATSGVESNTTNDTNMMRIATTNSAQIDATAKGYKPLITLNNTSNSVASSNNAINKPLTLLSASTSSSTSSTFNVARNGFRDKINISNQRNEFTTQVDDADDDVNDDEAQILVETDKHDNVDFKMKVQVKQSALRTAEKYNTSVIKNGLNQLTNSNINSASNSNNSVVVNNYVVPAASSFFEHVELAESSLSPDKRHELLLHRRKRYLVFPEGSSFQLVFDLIIGVVDYTSYAILGITCAVAWELPSKPPSEIIENFRDKLNEGTFGIQRRNDSIADKELQYIQTESKVPILLREKTKTTTSITSTATKAPTQFSNFEYENAWKPQKYVDTTNYFQQQEQQQQQKYIPRVGVNTAPLTAYYGYKTHNEYGNYDESAAAAALPVASTVLDMAGGTGFAKAQRKTLNDKAAQWNRPKIDKAYTKYNKNYSTKQNYEWRGNDKWKKYQYVPYVATATASGFADWHRQRMSSSSSDNHDSHDDYNADNVNYDERQQQQKNYANWRKKDNWWRSNSQHWIDKQKQWAKYEAEKQNLESYTAKRPITAYASPVYTGEPQINVRTGRQRKILKEPPKHRIYPVFGRKKRSLENEEPPATPFEIELERIHFREHLQSRQKLYGKIEQLFQTRGHNGTACVLRALCETGQRHQLPLHHRQYDHQRSEQQQQRHHDHHQAQEPHSTTGPQSFITELLRAVFALPKDIRNRELKSVSERLYSHAGHPSSSSSSSNTSNVYSTNDDVALLESLQREFEAHISSHYRDAHAYTGNCAKRFASCEHSIWNDGIRNGDVAGRAFKM